MGKKAKKACKKEVKTTKPPNFPIINDDADKEINKTIVEEAKQCHLIEMHHDMGAGENVLTTNAMENAGALAGEQTDCDDLPLINVRANAERHSDFHEAPHINAINAGALVASVADELPQSGEHAHSNDKDKDVKKLTNRKRHSREDLSKDRVKKMEKRKVQNSDDKHIEKTVMDIFQQRFCKRENLQQTQPKSPVNNEPKHNLQTRGNREESQLKMQGRKNQEQTGYKPQASGNFNESSTEEPLALVKYDRRSTEVQALGKCEAPDKRSPAPGNIESNNKHASNNRKKRNPKSQASGFQERPNAVSVITPVNQENPKSSTQVPDNFDEPGPSTGTSSATATEKPQARKNKGQTGRAPKVPGNREELKTSQSEEQHRLDFIGEAAEQNAIEPVESLVKEVAEVKVKGQARQKAKETRDPRENALDNAKLQSDTSDRDSGNGARAGLGGRGGRGGHGGRGRGRGGRGRGRGRGAGDDCGDTFNSFYRGRGRVLSAPVTTEDADDNARQGHSVSPPPGHSTTTFTEPSAVISDSSISSESQWNDNAMDGVDYDEIAKTMGNIRKNCRELVRQSQTAPNPHATTGGDFKMPPPPKFTQHYLNTEQADDSYEPVTVIVAYREKGGQKTLWHLYDLPGSQPSQNYPTLDNCHDLLGSQPLESFNTFLDGVKYSAHSTVDITEGLEPEPEPEPPHYRESEPCYFIEPEPPHYPELQPRYFLKPVPPHFHDSEPHHFLQPQAPHFQGPQLHHFLEPEQHQFQEWQPHQYRESEPRYFLELEPYLFQEPEPHQFREPEPYQFRELGPNQFREPETQQFREPAPHQFREPGPYQFREPEPYQFGEPEPYQFREPEPYQFREPESRHFQDFEPRHFRQLSDYQQPQTQTPQIPTPPVPTQPLPKPSPEFAVPDEPAPRRRAPRPYLQPYMPPQRRAQLAASTSPIPPKSPSRPKLLAAPSTPASQTPSTLFHPTSSPYPHNEQTHTPSFTYCPNPLAYPPVYITTASPAPAPQEFTASSTYPSTVYSVSPTSSARLVDGHQHTFANVDQAQVWPSQESELMNASCVGEEQASTSYVVSLRPPQVYQSNVIQQGCEGELHVMEQSRQPCNDVISSSYLQGAIYWFVHGGKGRGRLPPN